MELVKIYFKKLNEVADLQFFSNFLAFYQFLVDKFTLLDPDPGGKMNADPDLQPCIEQFCIEQIRFYPIVGNSKIRRNPNKGQIRLPVQEWDVPVRKPTEGLLLLLLLLSLLEQINRAEEQTLFQLRIKTLSQEFLTKNFK